MPCKEINAFSILNSVHTLSLPLHFVCVYVFKKPSLGLPTSSFAFIYSFPPTFAVFEKNCSTQAFVIRSTPETTMPMPQPRVVDAATAKIVLLGESAVGKSSVALRFAHDEFLINQETTVGAAFLSRTVTVPPTGAAPGAPSRALKFEIWDTAGQERYRSLAPIYYRGACGALVMYDITSSESLKRAQTWIKELRANADPTLITILVGNKKDLESLRQVSYEDGRALAAEEEVAGFFETSAKDNYNIQEVFADLAVKLLDHGLANSGNAANTRAGARRLAPPPEDPQPQQSNTCC